MSRQRPDRPERRGAEHARRAEAEREALARLEAEQAAAMNSFAVAMARPAGEGGTRSDRDVLERLRAGEITGMGRVVYSSNAVFLVELEGPDPTHPDEPLRAIYKPARGERPLWDFPRGTLHLREVAAYLVSAALGDGLVPPTTLRDGPHGPGSMQLFIHAHPDPGWTAEQVEDQLLAIAALDVVLNNADRKRAHLLFADDGRLRGIDNALSFLPYPHQRTVLLELGGRRLPAPVVRRFASLGGNPGRRRRLTTHLADLLSEDEVSAFSDRLDATVHNPRYPFLDPWEGRPFEWW